MAPFPQGGGTGAVVGVEAAIGKAGEVDLYILIPVGSQKIARGRGAIAATTPGLGPMPSGIGWNLR